MSSDEIPIDDLWDYDPMTSDSGKWVWDTGISRAYSTNGCRLTLTTGSGVGTYNNQLPSNYEVEATFSFESSDAQDMVTINTFQTFIGTYNGRKRLQVFNVWPPNYYTDCNNIPINSTVIFRVENEILSVIHEDNVLITCNVGSNNSIGFTVYNTTNRNRTVKDIKIRQL